MLQEQQQKKKTLNRMFQNVSFPKPTVIQKVKENLLSIPSYQKKKQIETRWRSKRTISYSHSG